MTDVVWEGITRAATWSEDHVRLRSDLADAAKESRWSRVFEILEEHEQLVNACRPDGKSLYTPLHQAAYSGAPHDVVERLISAGAFRTIANAWGERPIDVARRRRQGQLFDALDPVIHHRVSLDDVRALEIGFHSVILGRVADLVEEHRLRLPRLEPLLEQKKPHMWFAVPGMYGGFSYRLTRKRPALLLVESWCRVSGGSGQRHEVTLKGATLVAEGFV